MRVSRASRANKNSSYQQLNHDSTNYHLSNLRPSPLCIDATGRSFRASDCGDNKMTKRASRAPYSIKHPNEEEAQLERRVPASSDRSHPDAGAFLYPCPCPCPTNYSPNINRSRARPACNSILRVDKVPQHKVPTTTMANKSNNFKFLLLVLASIILLLANSCQLGGANLADSSRTTSLATTTPFLSSTTLTKQATSRQTDEEERSSGHHYYQDDARGRQLSNKDRNVIQSTAFNGRAQAPSQGRELERLQESATTVKTTTTPMMTPMTMTMGGHQRRAPSETSKSLSMAPALIEYHLSHFSEPHSLVPIAMQQHQQQQQQFQRQRQSQGQSQAELREQQQQQVQVTASQRTPIGRLAASSRQSSQQAPGAIDQRQGGVATAWPSAKNNQTGPASMGASSDSSPPLTMTNRTKPSTSTATTNTTTTSDRNFAGDPDLMAPAASSPVSAAVVANENRAQPIGGGGNGLVPMQQLPLSLHMKLKPLALPMPPPPSVRQQVGAPSFISTTTAPGATLTETKRRRSLEEQRTVEHSSSPNNQLTTTTSSTTFTQATSSSTTPTTSGTTTSTTTTTTTTSRPLLPLTSATTTGIKRGGNLAKYKTLGSLHHNGISSSRRHSFEGDLQALTWQEAKRVLMMNSIVPPLVQAANRVLERRHSLLGVMGASGGDGNGGTPVISRSQREAPLQATSASSLTSSSSGNGDGPTMRPPTSMTTLAKSTTTKLSSGASEPSWSPHSEQEQRQHLQQPVKLSPETTTTTRDATGVTVVAEEEAAARLQTPTTPQPTGGNHLVWNSGANMDRRAKQLTNDTVDTTTTLRTGPNNKSTTVSSSGSGSPGSTTALSLVPLSQARARGQQQTKQGHQHQQHLDQEQQTNRQQEKRLDSMYQIELNDLSIGGSGSGVTQNSQHQEPAPFLGAHEDEARIQQMAAAMLPFVWPSFQLTAAGQNMGKLRIRSLDSRQSHNNQLNQQSASPVAAPTSTSTASPVAAVPTWPMKYQQLSRADRSQQQQKGIVAAPAAASEFKPTFVDMDEELEKQARWKPRSVSSDGDAMSSASSRPTTTTTTTSTTPAPVTTSTIASSTTTTTTTTRTPLRSSSASESGGSRNRKRRKKSGYLQQQQQRLERQRHELQMKKARAKAAANTSFPLEQQQQQSSSTPSSLNDSTRLASSYPLPRIKFNASLSATTSALEQQTSSTRATERITGGGPTARPTEQQQQQMEHSNGTTTLKPQIPKSLSQLIEQQLLRAASSNLSSSSSSTIRQNLLLLQEYFASTQTNWSQAAGGSGKLMLAPTTSISKVVRLPTTGAKNQSQAANSLPSVDIMRTTTTTNVKPATLDRHHQTAGGVGQQQQSAGGGGELDRSSSGKLVEGALQMAPIWMANTSANSNGITAQTTATTTTTTKAPTTTTTLAVHNDHQETGDSAEIGSNKILPEDDESSLPSSQATTATTSAPRRQLDGKAQLAKVSVSAVKPRLQMATGKAQKGQLAEKQPQVAANTFSNNKNNRWQKQDPNNNNNNGNSNGKNIKLFHFKRKPDMNKLPFYKKPLNYTELGWSAEEIEREQKRLLELQQFSGQAGEPEAVGTSSSSSSGVSSVSGELEVDEDESATDDTSAANTQTEPTTASLQQPQLAVPTGELLLLKRKRRARSQFERLMAELQAAALAAAAGGDRQQQQQLGITTGSGRQAAGPSSSTSGGGLLTTSSPQQAQLNTNDDDDQRVPVIRKKVEPLVMKPMFFNVNQKRRPLGGEPLAMSAAPSNATTTTTTTTTERPTLSASDAARSKPIVRMRRKDHGEQTTLPLELEPVSTPWRPTRPNWAPPSPTTTSATSQRPMMVTTNAAESPAAVRIMLVPSGLLTPSGSHPVPLFAATTSPQAPAWSPQPPGSGNLGGSSTTQRQSGSSLQRPTINEQVGTSATTIGMSQSLNANGGGALHLAARPSTSPPMAESSRPSAKPAMIAPPMAPPANSAGELRVPKLLVKPMRPAKYSLNGYIPKPSLGQAQSPVPMSPSASLAQTSLGGSQQALMGTGAGRGPKAAKRQQNQQPVASDHHHHQQQQQQQQQRLLSRVNFSQTNKDLDSSTSNEIFSRRRGLEQAAAAASGSNSNNNNNLGGQQARFGKNMSAANELTGPGLPLTPGGLTDSLMSPALIHPSGNPKQLLQQQRIQMEENKRKYVRQQQQANSFRSPTLSIQKANQIKAKLGLSASLNSIRPHHSSSSVENNNRSHKKRWPPSSSSPDDDEQHQRDDRSHHHRHQHYPGLDEPAGSSSAAASTNRLSAALDPPLIASEDPIAGTGAHTQMFATGAGSPYNSIPKTDFECTNKKGQFVSGLFADVKTGCRVWHLCSNNRRYSFLCPTGTIFNSKVNSCDWKHSVRCAAED